MPIVICPVCNTSFYVPNSRLKSGRGKYCSRKCSTIVKTKKKNTICKYCGKQIKNSRSTSQYCSRKCATYSLYKSTNFKKTCQMCKKEFSAYHFVEKFCSSFCEAKHAIEQGERTLINDPWDTGAIIPEYCDNVYYRAPDEHLGF